MKTTLELPDALVKQIKLRAIRDGLKLKDAVASLLRKGLAAQEDGEPVHRGPKVITDKLTGLPVIVGGHRAAPGDEITPERLFEITQAQEIEWHEESCRQ